MGRGPSYPYVGLEDAIALSRKMYDYAKRGAAPLDAVVKDALKYSATSSSGQKVLAALKSFGLIEDAPGSNGKAIKLTQRAIRILLDEQDSQERREEIRKAALSPKWYEYCWKKWGKEMPPAMKSNLLIEHGFVDSTVDGFLKDYKKTISFAALLDDDALDDDAESAVQSNALPKIGDYVQWESQGILRMPVAKRLTKISEDGNYAFVEGSLTGIPVNELIPAEAPEPLISGPAVPTAMNIASTPGSVKMLTDMLTLAEGITLQLQWPAVISQDAYEDFEYQLEGFKKRVKRAIKSIDSSPSQCLPEDAK